MVDSPQVLKPQAIKFSILSASYVQDKYTVHPVSSETLQVYKLQMETQMGAWTVEKRYSDFSHLHAQMSKTRKTLPKLPPKKINKMKDQVVEQRKVLLANYMNELCFHFNIFEDKDIIEFIQLKDKEYMRQYFQNLYEYQETLLKEQQRDHRQSDVSEKSIGTTSDDNSNLLKSPRKGSNNLPAASAPSLKNSSLMECEKQVVELLEQLERDSDKFSNVIKNFEEYYFSQKPILSTNYIKRLLFGDGYKIKGLLQHLMNIESNTISAVNLINFIARLLDYRRNHQIEVFRKIFTECDQMFVKNLGLEHHIENASCKDGALYIINEYVNAKLIDSSKIFTTKESLGQFEKWRKTKQVVQKSYMSSISPMRIQQLDSAKNQLKKSFNFERADLKKNRSFIDFNQGSDQRMGEDDHSDNGGRLTPIPNKTSEINITQQKAQGSRFQTFTNAKQNFSSFKKDSEPKTEEKRKESGRTDEENKVIVEDDEEFFQSLKQELKQEYDVHINRATANLGSEIDLNNPEQPALQQQ